METSSLALAEGCGELLAPDTEILVEMEDWQSKKTVKDSTVGDIFSVPGLQRCGYDWFSQNHGNVFVLCLRCARKLGWRW